LVNPPKMIGELSTNGGHYTTYNIRKAKEAAASMLSQSEHQQHEESADAVEFFVDAVTNTVLSDFPVHCAFRTLPISQPSLHSHLGYEWYLCLSGSGAFIAGDRVHTVRPGTLIIVKPMSLHLPRSVPEEPFHRYVLTIDREFLERLWAGGGPYGGQISRWLPPAGSDSVLWQLNARQLLSLQEAMSLLEREIEEKRDCFELAVQSLLLQMFVGLERLKTEPAPVEYYNGDRKRLVEGILGFLTEHYREQVHTEDLCRRFHLSRSYLHRIFKQETGVSMNEFLIAYRINKAKELLKNGGDPLAEVAAAVGFQDLSHFCHMFKRLAGMTPGRFRSTQASLLQPDGDG
jgi:AraC-like DNA-binding protein/quercetin dioxygenase-like cupin family protein